MQDSMHFADAFNYYLFDGKQMIHPEDLQERDTAELAGPFADQFLETEQKYRDSLKLWCVKESPYGLHVLLGIETQSSVHYAMPVRSGLYDFIQYAKQVGQSSHIHRKTKQYGTNRGEFLSGFHKDDRLIPVITLVLSLDSRSWDGPLSLHEMFGMKDRSLLRFIPDYRLNLITPYQLTDSDLNKFTTELRNILKIAKYMDDPVRMISEIMEKDASFQNVGIDTLNLINSLTNIDLKRIKGSEEGKYNMCRAMEEYTKECELRGEKRGLIRGEKRGLIRGEKRGMKTGELRGYINALREIGMEKQEVAERVKTKFGYSSDQALKQVGLYWENSI